MMDFFEIDRSIVAIAMYYQDRYLGTEKGRAARTNRSIFRIVSVTSLYMALKLSQPGNKWNITSHAFAKLCQGAVLGDEINDVEIDILFALDWHVNPPTPMKYAEALLELLFNGSSSISGSDSGSSTREDYFVTKNPLLCDDEDTTMDHQSLPPPQELREHVHELISCQLEVALQDKRLFQARSSAIGTAAVVNALKGIQYEGSTCDASFCQESIDTVVDMMTSCNLVSSEECLEVIRSVLLNSVVSPGSNDAVSSQEDDTDTERASGMSCTRAQTPPPPQRKVRTPPVSSSPTSIFQVLTNSAQARTA